MSISSIVAGAFLGFVGALIGFFSFMIIKEAFADNGSIIGALLLLSIYGMGAFFTFKIAAEICAESVGFCGGFASAVAFFTIPLVKKEK
jgi:hypothetical protein